MADCVVCLDPLISEVEGISCAPCGHLFHYQCILQWLELGPGKSKCPICKQPASPRKIRRIFLDIEAIQAAKPRTPDHAIAGSSKETRNGKAPAVLSSALDVEQLQLRLLSAAVEDCKETITQLENLVTDLNSTIRKNESTIKKSNERISDIEATVVKLTQQLELQRTELEQLQRKYQAVKKRYAVQKGLTSVAELDTLNKSAEAKHFFNTLKALPHDGLAEVLTSMEMRMTTMQRDNDMHLRKYNEERKRRQDVEARNATVEKRYIKLDKQRKQLEQKLELADQRIQEIGMRLERASNEKPSVKRQRLGGNDEEDEEKSVKQLVDQDAEDENRDPDTDWDSPSPTPVGTSSHSYRKVNGDLDDEDWPLPSLTGANGVRKAPLRHMSTNFPRVPDGMGRMVKVTMPPQKQRQVPLTFVQLTTLKPVQTARKPPMRSRESKEALRQTRLSGFVQRTG